MGGEDMLIVCPQTDQKDKTTKENSDAALKVKKTSERDKAGVTSWRDKLHKLIKEFRGRLGDQEKATICS